MRELSSAISMHMLRLPADEKGIVEYNGVTSSGSLRADDERVFIRAKGQLHFEEVVNKRKEKVVYTLLAIAVAVITHWLVGILHLVLV